VILTPALTPPVALSVSPARVALVAPASRAIELRNLGVEPVVVDVKRKSVDGRAAAKRLLGIRPAQLVLRPGASRVLTLRAEAERRAGPGDHQFRVLFVARPVGAERIAVRVRLGVGIRVRVPGRAVRRVDVRGLRVRRHGDARILFVSVANAGNVTEQLRGPLTVTLSRQGRFVSRLRLRAPRELFPGTHTVLALPYLGHARGLVRAVVRIRLGSSARPQERRYRIRL
jgi:hypothetical protein